MAVLQLTDAARDADGPVQLWRIFSKCATSLQDGARLQNIAWRLAFCDLHPSKASTGHHRPAGHIICEMIPSRAKMPAGRDFDVSSSPTPPRLVVVNPTPNLTPHPTPPATPLLVGTLSPSIQHRRDVVPLALPPLLPRSVTRGMGSPVYPPPTQPPDPSIYAPKSTHILPVGGGSSGSSSGGRSALGVPQAHGQPRFFLHVASSRSGSSHSTSSHSTSSRSRDSNEDGGKSPSDKSLSSGSDEAELEKHAALTMYVGRGRAPTLMRAAPKEQERERDKQAEEPGGTVKPKEPDNLKRTASVPFLGGLPDVKSLVNGQISGGSAHARRKSTDDADGDTRSVSSMATSSSQQVKARAKAKQVRPPLRSRPSNSRTRTKGALTMTAVAPAPNGHTHEAALNGRSHEIAPNALGLPPTSNLAAAAAMVERTMSTRNLRPVVVATSDEEDGWSDDDDDEEESLADGSLAEGDKDKSRENGEEEEDEDGEWEDASTSDSPAQSRHSSDAHTKAPPPSLQQNPPPLTHARGHSTSGADTRNTGAADLRHLPTRPHRSTGHLPALAQQPNAQAGPSRRTHTANAQNARTRNALQATMSDSRLASAMQEAQRQTEMFAKAPRVSYENLTQLAGARPSGLSMLLRPTEFQQESDVPVPRKRPAGGFGRLGLTMTHTHPPVSAGGDGSVLSPIPPTPATAAALLPQKQQLREPAPVQAQAPPRRPPMAPRALSTPHFVGAGVGTSGSLGKSTVAGPVVTNGVDGELSKDAQTRTPNGSATNGSGGGYRPKGPPAEMEYDDDDDDESDADGHPHGIGDSKGKGRPTELQLSKSVAQEKLRVLAERSDISRAKQGGVDSAEAERRRLFDEAGVAPWAKVPAANAANANYGYPAQPPPNRSMSSVPVGFPYNLPAPAPPSTPRTTRQQMLRNEMSESLRHNLLWQRKLSRTDVTGPPPRRTKSTVNVLSTTEGFGRQPEKSLVRLTPRPPRTAPPDDLPPAPMIEPPAPKKKLVRNMSWADTSDYHRSGW